MGDLAVLDLFGRLGSAALVGALIGYERERRLHPAGARTHALAALGAAVFTVAGGYGFDDVRAATSDPARVAAQVATGIGFVGGGAILRTGVEVRGLTTASTLWLVAAAGVAAGAGMYLAVAFTGVVGLGVLLSSRFRPVHVRTIELEYERGHGTLGPCLRELKEAVGDRVDDIDIDDEGERRVVRIRVRVRLDDDLHDALAIVRERPEVIRVELA